MEHDKSTASPAIARARCARWPGRVLRWALLAVLLIVGWRAYDIVFGGNFHAVAEGQCYRSAQPSAGNLTRIVRRHGIRTVINLRGLQDDEEEEPWYPIEIRTARALGVKLVHVGLWSFTPPEREEFRLLVRSLADDPGPFLIHCHSGSDRTGLAAALFLLLRTEATLPQAKHQLSIYYGHFPWGRASCHDRVLDCYGRWLTSQSKQHSPQLLRQWALEVYDEHVEP